jgi:AcrR family transcriptional regulator
MRMSRAEAKAANRRALLASARLLVSQDGAAVSVEAIASAADLTTGAVYSIFGSKNDLLVALIHEDVERIDEFLGGIEDPALTLEESIDAYLEAWLASYAANTAAQNMFGLHVVLAAAEDSALTAKLTASTTAETLAIARHFTDRSCTLVSGEAYKTTPDDALEISMAIQAVLSGFSLREGFSPDQTMELVRRTCRAVAHIVVAR